MDLAKHFPQGLGRSSLLNAATSLLLFFPYIKVYNSASFTLDKLTLTCLIFYFLSLYLSRMVYVLLAAAIIAINCIFLHVKHHWGVWNISERISIAMESPTHEMMDYVTSYLTAHDLLLAVYVICAIALVVVTVRNRVALGLIPKILIGAYCCAFLFVLPRSSRIVEYPLTGIPMEIYQSSKRAALLAKREEIVRNYRSEPTSCSEGYQNVVIVIGESVLRDRMSVYGHPDPTTPFLDSLKPQALNALAASNQTRYAVPLMLTKATVSDFSPYYRAPSLVSELERCGYKTYWLSNQATKGKNEDMNTSIGYEADFHVFLSTSWFAKDQVLDEALLGVLQRLQLDGRQRSAFFVHLMGSHFDYANRVPPNFGAGSAKGVVGTYDMSLKYTDSVLAKLYGHFSPDSLLFIYVADHGEVVGEKVHGHGFSPAYRNEFRPPLLLWSSKPNRILSLRREMGPRTLNLESFDEMIRYLVGIDPTPASISYSGKVIEVSRKNIVEYESRREYSE